VHRIGRLSGHTPPSAPHPSGALIHTLPDLGGLLTVCALLFAASLPADAQSAGKVHRKLAINLRTAKALGFTLPPSLLRRADHIVQ